MTNPQLPPIEGDTNEDTAAGLTRPHVPMREEATEQNKQHKTEVIRKAAPPPSTGHVQAVGQKARQAPPQGYRPRPARRKGVENSGLYLPWWSIVLMLLGVIIVAGAIVGGVYLLGNSGAFLPEPTPIIMIITANPDSPVFNEPTSAPPSTEIIAGGNAPSDLQLAGPTLPAVILTPTPSSIRVGSAVAVAGVDENKLNVRSSASITQSEIVFRAEEGEIFSIVEGPTQADGFTWWKIQDPNNAARNGWAVANYLAVLPSQ